MADTPILNYKGKYDGPEIDKAVELALGLENPKSCPYYVRVSLSQPEYVLTIGLGDSEGNIFNHAEIDLPLESMIVNATYSNGNIILHLQDGTTTEPIPISALIAGLVSETRTIAGIDLKDNITQKELRDALDVYTKDSVDQLVSDLEDSIDETLNEMEESVSELTPQVEQNKSDILSNEQEIARVETALQNQIDGIVLEASGSGDVTAEVIQARTNAKGTTYRTLKTRLDDIDNFAEKNSKNIIKSSENNIDFSVYTKFEHFGLTPEGDFLETQPYRVSASSPISFNRDIEVTVAIGFKWGYLRYENSSSPVWDGWNTKPITIPANTEFQIQIARVNENTTETADVDEFVNALSFDTIIDNIVSDVKMIENIVFSAGITNGDIYYENGTISNNGSDYNETANRIRTNYIECASATEIVTTINAGYKYGIHLYDKNKNYIRGTQSWIENRITSNISDAFYIRFNFAPNSGTLNAENANNMGFRIWDIYEKYSANGIKSKYEGKISLASTLSYKQILSDIAPETALPSMAQQGMSVYDNKAFLIFDKGGLVIYDMLKGEIISEIILASAGEDNHCNSCSFGNKLNSDAEYPLLYISECYGQHRCFVENISNHTSNIVQTISFSDENNDYTDAFDWIIDKSTNLIMTYGNTVDGKHKIKTFNIPDTSTATVLLAEENVIEQWVIEDYIPNSSGFVYQGNCAKNGIIYIATYNPNFIYAIKEDTHEIVASVPLNFIDGEPEDIAIDNGIMFIVYQHSKLYTLNFDEF